jgi:hypothetical protein
VTAANGWGREWSAAREERERGGLQKSGRGWLGLERRGASKPPDAKSTAHNINSPVSSRPQRMNGKILPTLCDMRLLNLQTPMAHSTKEKGKKINFFPEN